MQGKIKRWAFDAIKAAPEAPALNVICQADPDHRPGEGWQVSASRALCGLVRSSGVPIDPCVLLLYVAFKTKHADAFAHLVNNFEIVEDGNAWDTESNPDRGSDPGQLAQPV